MAIILTNFKINNIDLRILNLICFDYLLIVNQITKIFIELLVLDLLLNVGFFKYSNRNTFLHIRVIMEIFPIFYFRFHFI